MTLVLHGELETHVRDCLESQYCLHRALPGSKEVSLMVCSTHRLRSQLCIPKTDRTGSRAAPDLQTRPEGIEELSSSARSSSYLKHREMDEFEAVFKDCCPVAATNPKPQTPRCRPRERSYDRPSSPHHHYTYDSFRP